MEEHPLHTPAGEPIGAADQSPEARRKRALRWRAGLDKAVEEHLGPGSRAFCIANRVWTGTYQDGFIHAGNLAYMAILALFPFFITVAAVFTFFGEAGQRDESLHAFLTAMPPVVARVIEPVALSVMAARSGWLLWIGGIVGIWTVSSLIETIRDILHRAYGTPATLAFWRYRLLSTGMIVCAVVLLLLALFAQVAITAAQEIIATRFPWLDGLALQLAISRLIPALVLYLSLFVLFISLTPSAYRGSTYPKWPGALLVTLWWVAVTMLLPDALRLFFTYDLTYGSLAGVMIALFFFWLVGLGMVIGAELNAALAETPEERDMLGQSDNRARTRPKYNEDGRDE
jgi:membrane protein